MIIEAKPNIIDSSKIVVPNNYVLIKMDEAFESYQIKGKETGILAPKIVYDNDKQIRIDEKLVNSIGTVIKRPFKLVFNGREIKKLSDEYRPIREVGERNPQTGERRKVIVDYSALERIKTLQKQTLDYDTDVELEEGDRVHVNYLHFLQAEQQGLFIPNTDKGDLVLVKYDLLKMVLNENDKPKRMLNGFILIKPKEEDIDIKNEDGVNITERESGIVVINQTKVKRTRKLQKGYVVLSGTPLRGYMNDPSMVDPDTHYKEGDQILFDPRLKLRLENDLHQIISEDELYLIRREAILGDEKTFPNFEQIEIK